MRKVLFILALCIFTLPVHAAELYTVTIQPGPSEGKDVHYGTSFDKSGMEKVEYLKLGGWGDHYYSFIFFDLSKIPTDAIVSEASFSLFQRKTIGADNFGKLTRVIDDWNDFSVSLSEHPAYVDEGYEWSSVPALAQWWDVDATDLVQKWVNKEYNNYGFRVEGKINSNNAGRQFYSSDYLDNPELRPKLVITYSVENEPEPEKTPDDLIQELEALIASEVTNKSIQNSYQAQVKKILNFYETVHPRAAQQQISALIKKIDSDIENEFLDEAVALSIQDIVAELELLLQETIIDHPKDVPLITQIASPYPPASAEWSDALYAAGRASYAGSCGATIAQCGCALSSFAMLGQSFGLTHGVDGSEAVPPNIDAWLLDNNGYDSVGNINWQQAIKYFSKPGQQNASYLSYGSSVDLYTSDQSVIDGHLDTVGPVLLKTDATSRNGSLFTHFVLGTDKVETEYRIRDPLWYNTEILDDVRDRIDWVQDYNNVIKSGRLFTFNKQPVLASRGIEIHLASPAELLITDSLDRKLGKDPRTGEEFHEIPGGTYYEEAAVYSEVLADSGIKPHVSKILHVLEPAGDLFSLDVIGTAEGTYAVSVLTLDGAGKDEYESVASSTSIGVVDSFLIDVPDESGVSRAVDRLRELSAQIQTSNLSVSERLTAIADRLEVKNLSNISPDTLATLVGE